jgi:hypothetical protein
MSLGNISTFLMLQSEVSCLFLLKREVVVKLKKMQYCNTNTFALKTDYIDSRRGDSKRPIFSNYQSIGVKVFVCLTSKISSKASPSLCRNPIDLLDTNHS